MMMVPFADSGLLQSNIVRGAPHGLCTTLKVRSDMLEFITS
jgi:hypothetical protein